MRRPLILAHLPRRPETGLPAPLARRPPVAAEMPPLEGEPTFPLAAEAAPPPRPLTRPPGRSSKLPRGWDFRGPALAAALLIGCTDKENADTGSDTDTG